MARWIRISGLIIVALVLCTWLASAVPADERSAPGLAAVPSLASELPPAAAEAGLSAADWAGIQRQIAEYEGQALQATALGDVSALVHTETKKLTASDGAASDNFGRSAAISGDTLVVGAHGDDSYRGSAYVFERNQDGADNWGQVKKLTASDGVASDNFGYSVAISGDTIVVGAYGHDSHRGSAYVFERNQGGAGNWGQVKRLTASDGAAGDQFGCSVAISGDTLIVGAWFDGDNGRSSGSAYVFARNQGGVNNWGQVKKLAASDGAAGNQFGSSVAISGNTIVVGAWFDDDKGRYSGSAYLFARNQGDADNWGRLKKLTASDGAADDYFGVSVAISRDTLVVGAYRDDVSANPNQGSAYVFARNQGGADNWGQLKKLTASDGAVGDAFGVSVSAAEDTIVVGAANDDDQGFDSGSVYVFHRSQGGAENWGQVKKLTASDGTATDYFGSSVAAAGDTLVVGARGDDDKGGGSGSAYVFDEDWPVSGETIGDHFGVSVGTAGDVDGDGYADIIIGAYGYNSYTGRVYVYLGGSGGPSVTPVFTATGEAAGDYFGHSVGTAGDVDGDGYADVIVGAHGYNSNTGRVYIYLGGAGGLSATPAFTATGEAASDHFGVSVGTAGDVDGDGYADVIVGAHGYYSDTGRAYMYHGGAGGVNGTPAWTATGEGTGDHFGICVGTAGDVNGDGYADVIVGAWGYDGGAGRAYVYHGGPGDLRTVPSWTADGEASDDWFGYSVGTAGDIDGDGYADVIVGAYRYDRTGRAYVYRGGPGGASATPVFTATGETAGDRFGVSVGTAGDVNGDGYADVIIGAYRYGRSAGRAYVYGGGVVGLSASPFFTATGEAAYSELGRSVGTAGDVDGDGYADVIIGAFRYNAYTGRAYFYRGGAVGLSAAHYWTATGEGFEGFGISVGTAGDVDGDGYADVIVGAFAYNNDTGRAYLYRGGAAGLSSAPVWIAYGEASGDYFGYSVGTAGDVDGDGYADVIIGAFGHNVQTGRAYVYRGGAAGLSSAPVWTADGEAREDRFGYSVGTAGDVDGDGYADAIVGAPQCDVWRGRIYVYGGGASGLSTAPVFTATGEATSNELGTSVGTAGDVNGDGYADVIVGAPYYDIDPYYQYTGRAYVYLGSANGLSTTRVITASGSWERPFGLFGCSVGTAGDVDGDGYADVIIGASNAASGGEAYLYHGGADGLSATPAFTATGSSRQHLGFSVGTAGDVNGDGYADVVIGSDVGPFRMHGGGAYVYHGGASGLSVTPVFSLTGEVDVVHVGYSVGTAGDVDGDGYADVVVRFSYDSHPAQVHVYAGNGGGARQVLARSERSDGSAVQVQPWGLTYREDGFRALLNATGPRGRERVKLQVEACPPGVPFGHASCTSFTSPTWVDLPAHAAGLTLAGDLGGLARNTLYRWRARVLYAPFGVTKPGISAPPNPAHGPWRRFLGQALEADLRTGPVRAPVASIGHIWHASLPGPARQGLDTVYFNGSGYDTDEGGEYITAYMWTSSVDGQLSTEDNFALPASQLSVGNHTIAFKVRDNEGVWSAEVTQGLTVQSNQQDVHTLILVNRHKLATIYSESEADQVMDRLSALAADPSVKGGIVHLENDPDVAAAYWQWDAEPTNTERANAVAEAIKDAMDGYLAAHPGIEYLVIVGDDRVIPFRRVRVPGYGDSDYADLPWVSCSSVTGAAICADMTLTDDYYANKVPTVPGGFWLSGHELYIPDLATGRLIETPEEIIGQIDAFLASSGVAVRSAVVTGWDADLLIDAARAMCDVLRGDGITTDCELIGDDWYRDDFIARVLDKRHDIISINGHAAHDAIGVPLPTPPPWIDVKSTYVAAATADHTRALFYTLGCQSGLNVPPSNPRQPLDLAQAFGQHQANYVGNTGSGYGSSVVGNSEQLMLDFTEQLVYGRSATVGQALAAAKQEYYLTEAWFTYMDEKIMIESTLYGLPMFRYTTPAVTGAGVRAHGQRQAATPSKEERITALSNGVTVHSTSYRFPPLTEESTADGVYYHFDGTVHTGDGQPVQPKYVADISYPQTKGHGVVFRGGVYTDVTPFDPVVDQALTTETAALAEPLFDAPGWYPSSLLWFNHLERGDRLVVLLGQFHAASQTERLYDRLSADVYYHTDSDDWAKPTVSRMQSTLNGGSATVTVWAEDTSGIHAVVIAYTDGDGVWSSTELTQDGIPWAGDFPASAETQFFVQAVDGAGNVSVLDKGGLYYRPGEGIHHILLPIIKK